MSQCDTCTYYVYDEDYEAYVCDVNLDEDDLARFYGGQKNDCPYYRLDDEYRTVKKQI